MSRDRQRGEEDGVKHMYVHVCAFNIQGGERCLVHMERRVKCETSLVFSPYPQHRVTFNYCTLHHKYSRTVNGHASLNSSTGTLTYTDMHTYTISTV